MTKDSTGEITFERRSLTFEGVLDDPSYTTSYYYYYGGSGLSLRATGSGGYGYSYYGYTSGRFYAVTEGVDSAGNVTLSAYYTQYRYY